MTPAPATGPTLWETSIDSARQRAAKEDKPILIDFSAAPE